MHNFTDINLPPDLIELLNKGTNFIILERAELTSRIYCEWKKCNHSQHTKFLSPYCEKFSFNAAYSKINLELKPSPQLEDMHIKHI